MNRRDFFRTLVSIPIVGLIFGSLYAVITFLSPEEREKQKGVIEVGDFKDIPPGRSKLVRDADDNPVMIINSVDYGLLAMSAICTHLGCIVHRKDEIERSSNCGRPMDGNTHCVCHAGVYSVTGAVLAGPPPRPLPKYDVFVKNGKLYLGPLKPGEKLYGG